MGYISSLYGLAVALVCILAWASRDHVVQKLSLILMGAWAATNLAVALLGFNGIPLVAPTVEAVMAIPVAVLGFRERSLSALAVFILYGAMICLHMVAFTTDHTGEYGYRVALNVTFAVQLLVVGSAGAGLGVRHWLHTRGQRRRSLALSS